MRRACLAALSAFTIWFDATESIVAVYLAALLWCFPEPYNEARAMFSFARISLILYFCSSLAAAKSVPEPFVAALLSMLFITT